MISILYSRLDQRLKSIMNVNAIIKCEPDDVAVTSAEGDSEEQFTEMDATCPAMKTEDLEYSGPESQCTG